jgi:hypothetical protein
VNTSDIKIVMRDSVFDANIVNYFCTSNRSTKKLLNHISLITTAFSVILCSIHSINSSYAQQYYECILMSKLAYYEK